MMLKNKTLRPFTLALTALVLALSSAINVSFAYDNPGVERAVQCMKQKDYDQALKGLSEAIGLNPIEPDTFFLRAKCFMHLGNDGLAITDLNKVMDLAPKYWRGLVLRGIAYSRTSQDGLATRDFEQAIQLNPRLASKYFENDSATSSRFPSLLGDYGRAGEAIRNYKAAMQKAHQNFLPESNVAILEPGPMANKELDDGGAGEEWLSETRITDVK